MDTGKLSHLTGCWVIFYVVNREVEKKIKDLLDRLKVEGMRVWKVDI